MRWRASYAGVQGAAPGLEDRHWPGAGSLRRRLWRQFRAAGPMLDYLGRFADAYSVLPPSNPPT